MNELAHGALWSLLYMTESVSVNFFFALYSQVLYDRLQRLPGQKVVNFSKNEQPAQNCVEEWDHDISHAAKWSLVKQ